jgi:hypothetical protein
MRNTNRHCLCLFVIEIFLATLAVSQSTARSVAPVLPRETVDLTMPIQGGAIHHVRAGDARALQNNIDSATCGDTIIVMAGSTYTGSFTVPAKSCVGWIVIKSSRVSQLSVGRRVGLTNTDDMAKLSSNVPGRATIAFTQKSHNWRLIGLEVTTAIGMTQTSLIETEVGATSRSQLPSYVIVDRCYIHSDPTAKVRRGISFQVASGAVVDSDIREIHKPGVDSQAIGIWSGSGPFLIQNNFLSAASENVMVGGADPGIANLVPSDITIVGNHFWKNYGEWKGAGLGVKNLLEFKNAQRILVRGNVLEYSWAEAQVGVAILLTPRNQDGQCNWCTVQDVTIEYNLIRHAGNGIEIASSDDSHPSLPAQRVLIVNNVLTDISARYGGKGWAFENLSVIDSKDMTSEHDIKIDHNTAFADSSLLVFGDSGTIRRYEFTNNLGGYGLYGIVGSDKGPGSSTLTAYVPDAIYRNIVLLTASGTRGGMFPQGTFWNSPAGAKFKDYAAADYQLLNTSPYRNRGDYGKDIGVWDWTTFNAETANALSGSHLY